MRSTPTRMKRTIRHSFTLCFSFSSAHTRIALDLIAYYIYLFSFPLVFDDVVVVAASLTLDTYYTSRTKYR